MPDPTSDEPQSTAAPSTDNDLSLTATLSPDAPAADAPPADIYGDGYDPMTASESELPIVGESAAPLSRPVTASAVKQMPHSIEAEQSVLGGLMLNAAAWFKVADKIVPEDFYRAAHRHIFQAMLELSEINRELDPVTIKEQLVTNGKLNEAGGTAYLFELYESTPGVANIKAYAEIVKERATLRRLIEASQQIADRAFHPDGLSSGDLLNQAEQQIFDIAEGRLQGEGPQQAKPLLQKAVKKVQDLVDSGSRITGVATGFTELDYRTAGLQPSDLIIVAGRPSMGKTSFAMNLVEHAVMGDDSDGAVLVFSLEMPAELLMMRLLSSLGRIDQSNLRTGKLKDQDWASFTSAVNMLQHKPLYIDDAPNLSPNDLRTRAHRVRREAGGKLKLIMVDYLQLMRGSGQADNRTGEISEISRSLKALAKEMECPVIALSQLNRSLENRNDRRPVMADLRESGAIEQDADVIFFIYRDEVYNEQSADQGIAEIIIGKQRNGPIGMVKLAFLNHLTKFENLAPERYEADGFA